MSAYSTNETQFKDRDLLVKALVECGFTADKVELHNTAQQLIDYRGQATTYTDVNGDKAEVIIRRKFVGGAANDIGFKRGTNGNFSAIISQYDRGCGYNQAWLGKLSAAYARNAIMQKAAKQGLRFAGTTKKDGKTQLAFVRIGA